MKPKHVIPALALAALLGLAIHATVGVAVYLVMADRPSEAGCKAALIKLADDMIANPNMATPGDRPKPCRGLSDETYESIAKEVIWNKIGDMLKPMCDVPTWHPDYDYTLACNPDAAEFIEGEK